MSTSDFITLTNNSDVLNSASDATQTSRFYLAAFMDPRFKTLFFLSDEDRLNVIAYLKQSRKCRSINAMVFLMTLLHRHNF